MILSACNREKQASPNIETMNLANPASQKCIDDGFQLTEKPSSNNVSSTFHCINTANNKTCEQWAYFHNECRL